MHTPPPSPRQQQRASRASIFARRAFYAGHLDLPLPPPAASLHCVHALASRCCRALLFPLSRRHASLARCPDDPLLFGWWRAVKIHEETQLAQQRRARRLPHLLPNPTPLMACGAGSARVRRVRYASATATELIIEF